MGLLPPNEPSWLVLLASSGIHGEQQRRRLPREFSLQEESGFFDGRSEEPPMGTQLPIWFHQRRLFHSVAFFLIPVVVFFLWGASLTGSHLFHVSGVNTRYLEKGYPLYMKNKRRNRIKKYLNSVKHQQKTLAYSTILTDNEMVCHDMEWNDYIQELNEDVYIRWRYDHTFYVRKNLKLFYHMVTYHSLEYHVCIKTHIMQLEHVHGAPVHDWIHFLKSSSEDTDLKLGSNSFHNIAAWYRKEFKPYFGVLYIGCTSVLYFLYLE